MKIALLSFHNAANYGAALQAYALQQFLLNQNLDCEYLNYVNSSRKNGYNMIYHIIDSLKKGNILEALKYLLGTPFMTFRKRSFKKFYKNNLRVSNQLYRTQVEASATNLIYDKFIVGSDQVWCPENNGNDISYLLSFVKDSHKKISYSSSFGLATIPESLRNDYKHCLNEITYLSTRERYGCKLIKELTGRDAQLVLDPVFLLENKVWSDMIPERNNNKFIFAYTNRSEQLSSFLRQTQYSLNRKKIYKLSRQTSPFDFFNPKIKVMYSMKPETFLQSIRDAEFVVTASFHCLAFSLIFHKPFVCFLTGNAGKDERIVGLLTELGLLDRVFNEKIDSNIMNKNIDWIVVDEKVNKLALVSKNFLLNSIFA